MSKSDRVRFGAVLNYTPELIVKSDWDGLKRTAFECERLNYDSIWVMDHFTYHGLSAVMECYTILAALAAVTSKIRLGGLVTCNSYRHPPLAAKMAATIDVISNGRLEFGIGAGWKEDEYTMYGIKYPSDRVRIEQLREGLHVVKKMWTEPGTSFEGKYYRIQNMDFGPKPVQKPHPPVWVGGKGERYLLRVVAELADFSNMSPPLVSREEYRHKMDVLKEHCRAIGRSYDEITKSVGLEVHIARSEEEAKHKMMEAYAHQYFGPQSGTNKLSLEQYASTRLVGTPEQCVFQLKKWLQEDVDYVLVGWTMSLDDWVLFAERVISAFK